MRTQFNELSDSQWQFISIYFQKQKPKRLSIRSVVNAILYINVTGVQWRNLPSCYPKWESVYYYFSKWSKDGTFELIMKGLREENRENIGRDKTPSLVIIDSQSIKTAPFVSESVGVDGYKKIKGRKRHIAVDTQGYPVAVHVGAANEADGKAGLELLASLDKQKINRLETIRADKAYRGTFTESAKWFSWQVDTTQLPPLNDKGFTPQKNRWQIERTFGWLNFSRRLSKDYEKTTISSTAFIMVALSYVMIAKIE